jgi:hypothetical protein
MASYAQNEVDTDEGLLNTNEPKAATPAPVQPEKKPEPAPRSNYVDPKSGESHPLFDWEKHKGESEVAHPFAEKGLISITKDKTYIYTVKESAQDRAASIHVGMFNPVNLRNPNVDSGSEGASFADNYNGNNAPAILVDYEWQLFRTAVGKFGLTAGSGIFIAQGHGHFEHPEINPGLTPKETFTFAAFPTSGGAIYRLQFWDRQLFVPYGTGGGTLYPFTEIRDDNHGPRFGGALAIYVAGGVGLNLTYFDKLSAIHLDREYGINRIYLTGEFREVIALTTYNFGGNYLNFGFTAEF